MSTHSAISPPVQDAGFLGLSALARMFSGTVAGLAEMATYAPVTHHEVLRMCRQLNGMVATLEPQVVEIEHLAEMIHLERDIACGQYFGDVPGVENAIDALHLLIDDLTKSDQSVDMDPEINDHQRRQLHTAHQRIIALIHRCIAAFDGLMGAIITHDIDAEPPPDHVWDNLDDMLAALKAPAA